MTRLTAAPLSVPLLEPFVIATARVDVTPSVLVEIDLLDPRTGARATGLGESATLHPVTKDTQPSVFAWFAAHAPPLPMDVDAFEAWAAARLHDHACASQGLFTALEDARARLEGRPLRRALARALAHEGDALVERVVDTLATDVTLPIVDPDHMANLARGWRARGFGCFKVKVGHDLDADLRALERVHAAVPDATFRIDANAGFDAKQAITLVRATERLGLVVECFEQPCGRDALDAMAEVAAATAVPVIADESFQRVEDVAVLARARAADGVNLKLAKLRSPRAAVIAGRAARAHGMKLMVGAMVETRLGIAAAANVAAALGGVEFPDLDTAFLLAGDPFVGGYEAAGSTLTLAAGAGLGIEKA